MNTSTFRARLTGLGPLAVLVLCLAAPRAQGAPPPAEQQALSDLYSATNGAGWTNANGWFTKVPVCSWFGVTCDMTQSTVIGLTFPGNNLVGTLPSSIGNFTNLTVLDLGSNQISGPLPAELWGLATLDTLILADNPIGGSLPSAVSGLTSVGVLALFDCQLSGLIPSEIGNLPALEVLDLGINQLSGPIPSSLGNLTGLTFLRLDANQLSGEVPGSLQSLALLSEADFRWNALFTSDPMLEAFLDSIQFGGDFSGTQTVAPSNLGVSGTTAVSAHLTWTPIAYTADPGFYVVSMSTSAQGPFQPVGQTSDKTEGLMIVAGLTPGTQYFFTVHTVTQAHASNGNTVTSEPSPAVTGTTTSCTYSLLPASANVPSSGAAGLSFQVQTGAGCAWGAQSDVSWMTVVSGVEGNGTGTVTFDVSLNPGPARQGTLTAGGQTFTVNQADGCLPSLMPQSSNVGAGGGSGLSFQVLTGPPCPWTAASNDPWISVIGGSSGSGAGTVTYNVAPNVGPARTGTITAAGLTFTVDQAAGCNPSLLPTSANAGAGGATGLTFQVQIGAGCVWSASSSVPFLTVTGGTPGNGTGTVTYDVAANVGPARSGTITAAGLTFTVDQASGCAGTLVPPGANAGAGGATGLTFQVQIGAGCVWSASSNDGFLAVTNGTPGNGTGTVTYDVAANAGPQRTGTITAAGQTFTVVQANGCSASLVPTGASVGAAGGSGLTFQVQTPASCPWAAFSNDDFVILTGGASGSGNGTVTYSVSPNAGPARTGSLNAAGQTFTVDQAGDCTATLVPTSANVAAAGGSGLTFAVQAPGGCAWTAVSNAPFLTVSGGSSGSGNGTVTYDVAASAGPARSGTITAAGQTFTVDQSDGCSAQLLPTGANVAAGGAAGLTFQVQTSTGCPWTASSNSAFVTLTGGSSGTGTGTVTYDVAANSGPARAGTITAAGRTFTVDQAGGCSAQLLPAGASLAAGGATGQTFQVLTSPGCAYTATSNAAFLTITGGASGSGDGTVTYDVAANSGPARTGTITAAGQTFTVDQAGGCSATLVPAGATAAAAGGSGRTFQVQTGAGCAWTATSNAAFLTITGGASGNGDGVVTYGVGANSGPARTGTITAAGQTFTVDQADGCSATLVPAGATAPAAGAAGQTFQVQTGAGCAWTAVSSSAFLTITGGASGTGNGTVTYAVDANTGAGRTGTIAAAGQTFTVDQANGCVTNPALLPTGATAPAAGVAGQTFQVLAGTGCAWSAVSNVPWLTITSGASGSGPGTVTYDVVGNPGPSRTGTIAAAGNVFTVTQGDGCFASTGVSPPGLNVSAEGGSGLDFQVVAAPGCSWSATLATSWITITSGGSGTGNGTVSFSVDPNPDAASRVAFVTVEGATFAVVQAAADCAYRLAPPAATVPPAGTPAQTFQVQTPGGCPWMAVPGAPWITIASGASGSGAGSVTFAVAANPDAAVRTGTITVASETFTVTQSAAGCTYRLVPAGATAPPAGATGQTFEVQAPGGCPWTAATVAPWIALSSASGSGTGTVTYDVDANPDPPRTGTIQVAGQTFTVQQATDCRVPASPGITSFPTAPVVAGSSFTVSWSAVPGLPSTAFYEVEVGTGAGCASPVVETTTGLSVTIPTAPGVDAVHCVRVRAVAGGSCPGVASAFTSPVTVTARTLPAQFLEIQGQRPPARVTLGQAPPAGSTVVYRNVGGAAAVLTLTSTGGFFTPSPAATGSVAPGEDATIQLVFDPASTSTTGVRTGELVGTWSTPDGTSTVSSTVALTVFGAPSSGSTAGARLEVIGSPRVTFRQLGGNPPPQPIGIRNSGSVPVRIAPAIGPGGAWLDVTGDFATALGAGEERTFELVVDRSRRTAADGLPPLTTGFRIENVDGAAGDAATFEVLDEEPPAPSSGTDRSNITDTQFALILGSTVSTPVPGGAARSGPSGSQYVSDGWIRNRSSAPVSVDLYYTPENADGLRDPRVLKNTITIEGYGMYRLSDFVGSLFGVTGSGHVELRSPQLAQLTVRATTDSIVYRDGVPTAHSAEVPLLVSRQGVTLPEGGSIPEILLLTGLRGPLSGHRTNIVLTETVGQPIEVRATLFAPSGTRLGRKTVSLQPYSKLQINSGDPELFPAPYAEGTLEVVPMAGGGQVSAFATVLDVVSGTYAVRPGSILERRIPGRRVSRRPAAEVSSPAYLPTSAHGRTDDSVYRTRLAIANGSDEDVPITVTYVPEPGFGEPGEPVTVVVPRRAEEGPQTLTYVDVLEDLLGVEGDTRGMLRFEGELADLVFAGETTTPIDPANPAAGNSVSALTPAPGGQGKFAGVFYPESPEAIGLKATEADTVKPEVYLPAISDGAEYRSHLILAELLGQAAKVKVTLRKTGGAPIGEPLVVSLAPNERKQINRIINEIAKPPGGVGEFKDVEITVTAAEGKGRTVAMINRVSNDPASKRSDTFVLGPSVSSGSTRRGQK
ncbi:MAG: fibronectin type III domain-containing protein [Acidobacteria bacterium]|nr:fibronectin type III domain-containing protein [Acidobacteriota bacterium]